MERIKKGREAQLKKLLDETKKDNVLIFEKLGVDYLFVDEADAYKNLFLYTKMNNVAGISNAASARASDLQLKIEYINELHGGDKGVVFATGTPISNSMTEMYTMQTYLQKQTLARLGIDYFDAWAADFGETVTALELAPSGKGYRARTRFAKFTNLPELLTLYHSFADVKTDVKLDVPEAERKVITLKPSDTVIDLTEEIAKRADAIYAGGVDPHIDNMLKVTGDGKKLALDPRCIDPLLSDESGSKLNFCADNVYEEWKNSADIKGTQLVFCDLSTPKKPYSEYEYGKDFDAYNDLKHKLIERGIPENEIAFIHDANTDRAKQDLFDKINAGAVRVLIGSTEKCGAGTNVQKRLVAIHHLDAPYRPRDLIQRNGRCIRQGNMNKGIRIYTYATERTFDSYSYQILENKQRFISQVEKGDMTVREAEDIDEATLSYAEYWAGEDVYKPDNMEEASSEADSRGEYDKGAFDAVTRATANHGMHRGSFVQDAYILGENGKEYKVAKWTDANNAVLADGRTLTKNTNRDTKETTLSIGDETTKYVKTELKGIKYVPVAVDAADFHSLCENRSVYGNGSTLAGGYSENNLKAYSETAYVDSTTNGLKEATLNGTTWSFGARQTGSGSGILDEELHTASTITTTPKENVGSYGEKIRVDLTGDDYGALGSQMQTVKWTYYGNDSTYSDPVISYGTKFAADNWMHKMMGIQLGLTDSARFQLPSGYNGTGYWKITVYALGYEDYSTTFELTAANVAGVSEPMSEEQKTQLTTLKDEAKALLDAHGEVSDGESDWKALKDHYDEAVTLLAKDDATSAEAEELLGELPGLIAAVKPQTTEKTGEAVVKETNDHTVIGEYTAKVKVTVDSEGKIVSVTDNGTEPGTYNASYWNKARNYFSRFTGKTASEIDGIDATSGATVSLNAVKSAVKSALNGNSGIATLAAPTIDAADLRTDLVFAADEDAAFTVTGEEGSTTYTKKGENADASDITDWVKVDESKSVVVAGPSKDALNININDITNENETPSITEVILNAVSVEGEKKINDNIEEN